MKKLFTTMILLAMSFAVYAQDATERAILQRAGISTTDEGLSLNDAGHITDVNLSGRGLKAIPFPLLELPYAETISFSDNPVNGDIGTLATVYFQTSPTVGQALKTLWVENCGLTGNIAPLVAGLTTLEYIYAGGNHITDFTPIPEGLQTLVRLDMQQYDLLIDFTPGVTTYADLLSQVKTATFYDAWFHENYSSYEINCHRDGNHILRIDVSENEFGYWIENDVRLTDGETFDAEAGNARFRLRLHFQEGDVNLSGAVDQADVTETAEYIINNQRAYAYNTTAGDMNHDGIVNVLDLVALQHRVADITPATTAPGQNVLSIADLKMPHNEALLPYMLTNSNDIAALQFDLTLPAGLNHWVDNIEATERTAGEDFILRTEWLDGNNTTETFRILIWSPTGRNIIGNEGAIANRILRKSEDFALDIGNISITNAVLASPDSRNVLSQTSAGVIDFTSLPQLTVTADKTEMTEGETLQLTVALPEATAQPLEVTLQSEDNTRFSFQQKQTIAAGQTSATFTVTAVEDDIPLLEISNLFTVSAPDCDPAEVLVLLRDNDMPMLQLTIAPDEINELDGDGAATATLRRTSNVDKKVIVELSDNAGGRLTYQKDRLVMDAGVEELTFHLGASDNDAIDGDSTYQVTAAIYVASCQCAVSSTQSAGFVQASVKVLDDDGPNGHRPTRQAPDAIVSNITASISEAEVGTGFVLTATVKNQGTAPLGQVLVRFYRAKNGESVGQAIIKDNTGVGASQSVSINTWLATVGQELFYAVVNEEETVGELRFTNNRSADVAVRSLAPWTAAIDTDAKVYNKGEKVVFSGQLTGETYKIANTAVEVYIVNDGVRMAETVHTNEHGLFTCEWTPYALQSGRFTAGACYPGEETDTAMVAFDVYGLRRADNSRISYEVTVDETYQGNIMLENPGVLPLTAVRAAVMSAPDGCQADVTIANYIAADQKVPLQITLQSSRPSPEKIWEKIELEVATNEGVKLPITLNYYSQYAQGHLKTLETEIRTTMTKDQPRDYPLLLTNHGKGHTGKLSLSLPKCIVSPMGNTLAGIAPGDSILLPLRFVPVDDMQLNVPYSGYFSIDCENGQGLTMNYSVTPVSQEKGILHVDVTDEYT